MSLGHRSLVLEQQQDKFFDFTDVAFERTSGIFLVADIIIALTTQPWIRRFFPALRDVFLQTKKKQLQGYHITLFRQPEITCIFVLYFNGYM